MKLFLLLLLFCSLLLAETYVIKKDVISGGGGKITNASYILQSSFGQATSGKMTNPSYNLYGGFYNPVVIIPETPGWHRKLDIPSPNTDTLKAVYDGGALTNDGNYIYAFNGNKSNRFYKYTLVSGDPGSWLEKDSLYFRNKKIWPAYQADKKYVAAGAAVAYDDADENIYAIKGGGTRELWVYSISGDSWHYLNNETDTLPQTKGVKNGSSLIYSPRDEKIYLLAGITNKKDTNISFVRYTPTTHTWEVLPRLPLEAPVPPTDKRPLWQDGSCLTLLNDTFYALRKTSKQGLIYKYDGAWHYLDSVPYTDTLYLKTTATPPKWYTKKINLPKAGTAMASNNDDNIIYMVKGNGSTNLWQYTPHVGFSTRAADTIPNWGKMKGVKNGAALTCLDSKLFLLRGNKTRQFWCYVPTGAKSGERIANNSLSVIASQSEAISNVLSAFYIYPNPFTKQAMIRYNVPVAGRVTLKLYNTVGQMINTLVDEYQNIGSYTLCIDNCKLGIAKGVYFLKYETTTNSKEIKLIVE
jgi:Secretion system C-terminal sorting domain